MQKIANIPMRSQDLAGANRYRCFLPNRAMRSCSTPSGQTTEQYTRPKTSVKSTSATTKVKLPDNTAGINCILAKNASRGGKTPLTSRNNRQSPVKQIKARAIRSPRSMPYTCLLSCSTNFPSRAISWEMLIPWGQCFRHSLHPVQRMACLSSGTERS